MLLEVHSEFNWKCLVFDTNYCMDWKYWLCATTYYVRSFNQANYSAMTNRSLWNLEAKPELCGKLLMCYALKLHIIRRKICWCNVNLSIKLFILYTKLAHAIRNGFGVDGIALKIDRHLVLHYNHQSFYFVCSRKVIKKEVGDKGDSGLWLVWHNLKPDFIDRISPSFSFSCSLIH